MTEEECAYLKKAFVATERMWAENVAKVASASVAITDHLLTRVARGGGRIVESLSIRTPRAPTVWSNQVRHPVIMRA